MVFVQTCTQAKHVAGYDAGEAHAFGVNGRVLGTHRAAACLPIQDLNLLLDQLRNG